MDETKIKELEQKYNEAKENLELQRALLDRLAAECVYFGRELGKDACVLNQSRIVDKALIDVETLEKMKSLCDDEYAKAKHIEIDQTIDAPDENENENNDK